MAWIVHTNLYLFALHPHDRYHGHKNDSNIHCKSGCFATWWELFKGILLNCKDLTVESHFKCSVITLKWKGIYSGKTFVAYSYKFMYLPQNAFLALNNFKCALFKWYQRAIIILYRNIFLSLLLLSLSLLLLLLSLLLLLLLLLLLSNIH